MAELLLVHDYGEFELQQSKPMISFTHAVITKLRSFRSARRNMQLIARGDKKQQRSLLSTNLLELTCIVVHMLCLLYRDSPRNLF